MQWSEPSDSTMPANLRIQGDRWSHSPFELRSVIGSLHEWT